MDKTIDPKEFGLTSRTILKRISSKHITIVINRKSRIIMSDGKKILEKVKIIRKHNNSIKISLETNAPVCSKTTKFLAENGIGII